MKFSDKNFVSSSCFTIRGAHTACHSHILIVLSIDHYDFVNIFYVSELQHSLQFNMYRFLQIRNSRPVLYQSTKNNTKLDGSPLSHFSGISLLCRVCYHYFVQLPATLLDIRFHVHGSNNQELWTQGKRPLPGQTTSLSPHFDRKGCLRARIQQYTGKYKCKVGYQFLLLCIKNRNEIPGRGKIFFFSPKRPDRPQGPPNPLFNGYMSAFRG
jgi:hypothetical protein